jgi:hypothetical protein
MMLMSTSDPSISRDQASRDSSLMWMNSQQYQPLQTVDHIRTDTDMDMTYETPAEAPAVRGELECAPFFNFEEKPSPYFMPQLHQLKMSVSSHPMTGQMNVQRCLQSLELECFSIGSGTEQGGVGRPTGVPQPVSARDCLQVLIEDTMDEDTFQNQVDLEPRPIGTLRWCQLDRWSTFFNLSCSYSVYFLKPTCPLAMCKQSRDISVSDFLSCLSRKRGRLQNSLCYGQALVFWDVHGDGWSELVSLCLFWVLNIESCEVRRLQKSCGTQPQTINYS